MKIRKLELHKPKDARRFLNGPADKAAQAILEQSGYLQFDENFDDAIEDALEATNRKDEDALHAYIKRIVGGELPGPALDLDGTAVSTELRRTEAGFLIGLAAGLRMSGRKAGAR